LCFNIILGVGFETAVDLAKRGAKLYLGCRNKNKGVAASREIVARSGCDAGQVKFLELDLGFLKSVRKFADDFLASEKQLDILVSML
jgi:NAD(P)-dependent dehydrogenase (short-subunit alcohol dehydrogenase family)